MVKLCWNEEEEFDEICDQFRDQRVWSIQDGKWYKDNIGEVNPLMEKLNHILNGI